MVSSRPVWVFESDVQTCYIYILCTQRKEILAISHCVDTPPNNKTKQGKIARESPGCEGDINCFKVQLGGGELGVL